MTDALDQEAQTILQALIAVPFDSCSPVGRVFPTLTKRHSIYAVRHRIEGVLYIGKSQNPKLRFTNGHKALVWCWIERYNPEDVRITAYALDHRQWSTLSLDLENLIIRASEPPFNVKIPMRD